MMILQKLQRLMRASVVASMTPPLAFATVGVNYQTANCQLPTARARVVLGSCAKLSARRVAVRRAPGKRIKEVCQCPNDLRDPSSSLSSSS